MKDKFKILLSSLLVSVLLFSCAPKKDKKENTETKTETKSSFEKQVTDYIQKFPQQDTYNYMKRYTDGDASKLNTWILGEEPILVKAGEDKVVRMNNDTYYKMAFMDLSKGPVKLSSDNPSKGRFYSFQIMDNRNANFKNVVNPDGNYYLYYGEEPTNLKGELINAPSETVVVIVRVEVKDLNNKKDIKQAKKIFSGINIEGPKITEFPSLDLLSSFDSSVSEKATKILDSTFKVVPFRLTVATPEEIPSKVSYVNFAAGTKGGWGGPVTAHSSYETIFFDKNGEELDGAKGDYTITTSEPQVDAFWSVTAYDTERGGYFHPNAENKYHINGTTVVKNKDDSITFLFKKKCEKEDVNCLEIPSGEFDYVVRYYLPSKEIRNGDWEMSKAELISK